ncbi:MAG: SprT family zinc-dependent metalloprotease [Desulfosporosinus sp.]|nr:SprT family zinc-dependent metalloprotease [Desulfosporosinus sp.]
MLNFKIGSTVISYSIRRSFRAKYLKLSVGIDGVRVVAPVSMDDSEIISFVENKRDWIVTKYEYHIQRLAQIEAEREFVSGEKLLFMGKDYSLKVIEDEGRFTRINLTDSQFLVFINKHIPLEKRREAIRRKLEQWYISQAKTIIRERLEPFSDDIGVRLNEVRFKNQKTRWGSCSQKGNLNFNWKLVMAPMYIIDYVVVHELCHFIQMNHSKEFWQQVGNRIPDYKERRKWLKENGIKLNL